MKLTKVGKLTFKEGQWCVDVEFVDALGTQRATVRWPKDQGVTAHWWAAEAKMSIGQEVPIGVE